MSDIVLTVEKLVYGGEGLARVEGQVVLTPLVLPGEEVRAEVVEQRPQFQRARAVEVVKASAERQTAPCPYFGVCGGCHYQHANYEYQLAQKVSIVREVFTRVGKFEAPEHMEVISGPGFEYRNRIQLHFEEGRIGYHALESNNLVDVERCPISSPRLNEALAAIRRMAQDSRFPRFLRTLELFTNETEVQLNVLETERPVAKRFFEWCAAEIPGYLDGPLDYEAAGFRFRISPGAFFQVNRFLIEPLVEASLQGAEGESAVDLYAGAGLFTLPLAKRFGHVSAVETGSAACRDLSFNADRAGLQVFAMQTQAETFLRENSADFVLADPPRAGLGKETVRLLLERKPKLVTVVSCDTSTLARDLAKLRAAYDVASMTVVDLFPQTYHIEVIAKLRLR